jgi:four helix bundle protein
MQNYKALRVTGRAREVIRQTYALTRVFPSEELFGLTAQMRRAALSIGLNIAEGCGRSGWRDKARFFETSRSSAMELDFAIIVAGDLDYGETDCRDKLGQTADLLLRELSALIRVVKQRGARQQPRTNNH